MKTINLVLFLAVLALFSCRTTKHIQKVKDAQIQVLDSETNEVSNVVTVEDVQETYEKKLDTVIKVKTKAKATVKPEKGKTVSADVFDSLGNKLGKIKASLNIQGDAIDLDIDLTREVHATVQETGQKSSKKQTTEDTHKESAITQRTESRHETVNRDVERKTDFWQWAKLGLLALVIFGLVLNWKRIWNFLKRKILRK